VVVFIVAGHMYEQRVSVIYERDLRCSPSSRWSRLEQVILACLKQLQILYICNWFLALACLGVATINSSTYVCINSICIFIKIFTTEAYHTRIISILLDSNGGAFAHGAIFLFAQYELNKQMF
jgi:hypothetical protein